MTATPSDRPPGPAAPRTVGRYALLARIGEGGMGVVHLAEGPAGHRVALKALRPHVVGDDEGRQRLAREVASLRKVHSPHVAEVLDADPWGETPYVVTRYVPGHSLQEVVRRDGPLAGADLEHLARRLLAAVRDVHAAGVLHRDLKPTNVVMEGRSPVLIDFGLARLAEDPRLTATGWLLGTPGYLAPEMLFGDPATPATDVHGWAATLVYAATGRSPYGAGHSMAILDRTRRGEVDLSGVPARLRPLLAACLVVEPVDRPTAPEVTAELAALAAADLPTRAVATGPTGPLPTGSFPLTTPVQLVPHEDPVTEVLDPAGAVTRPRVPPVWGPPAGAVAASTPLAGAPVPPTRAYTVVAPPAGPPPSRIAPTPRASGAGPSPSPATAPGPGGWWPARRPAPLGPTPSGVPSGPAPAAWAPTPPAGPPAGDASHPFAAPAPAVQPYRPQGPALDGAGRARRLVALLAALLVVAELFRLAPYVTGAAVAALVVLLRGAALAQESAWRRRMVRGPRWSDAPRAVLGYPWSVLRGLAGSVLLLGTAATVMAVVLLGVLAGGAGVAEALLVTGALGAYLTWWGPGAERVRRPAGRALASAVRHPWTGWATVAALVVLAAGLWLGAADQPTSWSPASGPPWAGVRDLVRPFVAVGR